MSERDTESDTGSEQDGTGIPDEQLPDDLQPGEDNPLAEGLDDGETVDDLLDGGKQADQHQDDDGDSSADGDTDSED